MKATSLLLSSAALLLAGSAFSADLPAKKAAPAAAPSAGCPAFGNGFFAIPGSDTCLKIFGYIRADDRYISNVSRPAKSPYVLGYKFIVNFDVRNNTELGTVRSFIGLYSTSGTVTSNDTAQSNFSGTILTEKAYIEFAGLRAGAAASNVDFDNAYNNSGISYQPTNVGQLAYSANFGTTTVTFAAETAQDNNDQGVKTNSDANTASRPDLIIAATSTINDSFKLQGGLVSHEVNGSVSGTAQGFAAVGRADIAFAPVKLILNAAYATGANNYVDNGGTGNNGAYNSTMGGVVKDSASDASNLSTAYDYSAALEYSLGNNILYAYGAYENGKQDVNSYKQNLYGVGFKYVVAPGLYIRPEIYQKIENANAASDTTTNVFYLRIRRDF